MEKNKNPEGFNWTKWAFRVIIFLASALTVFLAFVGLKIWFIYSLYGWFVELLYSSFGFDVMSAKVWAAPAVALTLLALPWLYSFLFWGRRRKEVLIIGSLIFCLFNLGIYFNRDEVFFDRKTKEATMYMLKTRDGFRLSSRPDYDPKYGGQYKAMTSIMAQEYQHWKKTGKMEIPPVQEGQYFDRDTGESIVWYAERRENEIFLSSLPGYDQLTGTLLKPISREIVKKYEKYLPKAIKGSGGNQAKKETSKIQSVSSDKIKSDAMDLNNYKDRVNVRVDLSWYFSSPSIYEVDSSVALYVEKNQRYRMYSAVVEKIISSPPFIIIGVCFTPYYVRSLLETEAVLLDGKDGKYKVIKIITELDSSGNKLVLKGGQEKRVLYVFNNVEIIELDCGVLYLGEHWYSSQNKMMPRVYAHNEEVNGRRYGEIPISHLIRNVDVYKRIDEDGIVHFSSIPGPGWKLVIREQAERKPNLDVGRSIIPDSETEKLGKGTEKPLPNQEETTTKKIYKLNFIKFCKKH